MNWWRSKQMPTVCSNHSQKCVKSTDWSVQAFAKFYKKNPKGKNVGHAFLYVIKMVWKLRRRDLQKAHLMVPLLPDLLRQKCQQICFCHPPGPFLYPEIFAKSAQDWNWFFLHQRAPEQRECRSWWDRFALLQSGRWCQVTLDFDFFVITCQWFKLLKRCGFVKEKLHCLINEDFPLGWFGRAPEEDLSVRRRGWKLQEGRLALPHLLSMTASRKFSCLCPDQWLYTHT